jgi:hypothetical protein
MWSTMAERTCSECGHTGPDVQFCEREDALGTSDGHMTRQPRPASYRCTDSAKCYRQYLARLEREAGIK